MAPLAPLFGIRLEERVRKALDEATLQWPALEREWETVEWTLVHDPAVGAYLVESGRLRAFLFEGARSVGWPDIRVIYEESRDIIIIYDAQFTEAKTNNAGRA